MTPLLKFSVIETDFNGLLVYEGQIVILVPTDGKFDVVGSFINKVMNKKRNNIMKKTK